MIVKKTLLFIFMCVTITHWVVAKELPDINKVQQDLTSPLMEEAAPAPNKRVKMVLPKYQGTDIFHTLYLPMNWVKEKRYPVIVEYAGNGPFSNKQGDRCSGKIEDCNFGYGLSGGKDVIWVCLPFISQDRKRNQLQWWGNVDATVDYCKTVVPDICKNFGGDTSNIFLAGFSRGAIACNFIGLHDDEIAALWKGFICHSHYDGVKKWNYKGSHRASALLRLKRLKNRPQFISHEGSIDATKQYLKNSYPTGNFTFQSIPYRNHTDSWVLHDIAERKIVRKWFRKTLKNRN